MMSLFPPLLLVALSTTTAPSDAFVTPHYTRIHAASVVLTSSSGSGDNEPIFYDDFGAGDFGGSMPSQLMNSLSSRMSDTKNAEASYDAKLARNWRRGNWGVRGFGLDKTSPSGKPAIVSVVAAPTSSASVDISLPQDKALPEDRKVAVGRSDGSIFIIQLGYEYLTNFVSVSNPDEQTTQWMDAATVDDKSNNNRPQTKFGNGGITDTSASQPHQPQPFQVIHQFQATEKEEPVHSLVYHDTIEGVQLICTAAGESGVIKIWSLDTTESRSHGEELVAALSDAHSSKIISLKAMVIPSHDSVADERNVLFSASSDGTVALHDLDKKGELIFSCQCIDKQKNFGQVTCADVSNPTSWDGGCDENDRDVIFLGTSSGYVVGYVAEELMAAAASSANNNDQLCPVPSIQFRAHGNDSGAGEAVTAIRCGGHGTIPNTVAPTVGTSRMSSKILLTGGEDGAVKQWEILAQQSTFGIRLEHWPRMSSQRMKRRHHLFKGHYGAVTSISQQSMYDSSKFLTSGDDGSIRVWSATNGDELFSMDGFTSSVSSLACLGRDLLVTDGSKEYVCVHDFSIDDDLEAGYDLDW
jgi:WD40 repeat protein